MLKVLVGTYVFGVFGPSSQREGELHDLDVYKARLLDPFLKAPSWRAVVSSTFAAFDCLITVYFEGTLVGNGVVDGSNPCIPVLEFSPAARLDAAKRQLAGRTNNSNEIFLFQMAYLYACFTRRGQSLIEGVRYRAWTKSKGFFSYSQSSSMSSMINRRFGGTMLGCVGARSTPTTSAEGY